MTEVAYAVSPDDAAELVREGYQAEEVGEHLEPKKILLRIPPERAAQLPNKRAVPIRLGAELLAERYLILVPWGPPAPWPPAPWGHALPPKVK